jgi:hypothetical protein
MNTAANVRPFSWLLAGLRRLTLTYRNAACHGIWALRGKMYRFSHLTLRRTIGDAKVGARQ